MLALLRQGGRGLAHRAVEGPGRRAGQQRRLEGHELAGRDGLAQLDHVRHLGGREGFPAKPDAREGVALGENRCRMQPRRLERPADQQRRVEAGGEPLFGDPPRSADLLAAALEGGGRLGVLQPHAADRRPDRRYERPGAPRVPALVAVHAVGQAVGSQGRAGGREDSRHRRMVRLREGRQDLGHLVGPTPLVACQQVHGPTEHGRLPAGLVGQGEGQLAPLRLVERVEERHVELDRAIGDLDLLAGPQRSDVPAPRPKECRMRGEPQRRGRQPIRAGADGQAADERDGVLERGVGDPGGGVGSHLDAMIDVGAEGGPEPSHKIPGVVIVQSHLPAECPVPSGCVSGRDVTVGFRLVYCKHEIDVPGRALSRPGLLLDVTAGRVPDLTSCDRGWASRVFGQRQGRRYVAASVFAHSPRRRIRGSLFELSTELSTCSGVNCVKLVLRIHELSSTYCEKMTFSFFR